MNTATTEGTPGPSTPASSDGPGDGSQEAVGGLPQAQQQVTGIIDLSQSVTQAYEGFDPAVHASKDGAPVLKKGGGYAMKRGRKGGSESVTQTGAVSSPGNVAIPGKQQISNDQAAQMIVGLTVHGFIMLLGDEWDVEEKDEYKALHGGFKAYLDATGGLDMSPSVGLLFVLGGYAAKRVGKPETKSRLKSVWAWVSGFWRK
jgi:hypothetical protein